MRDFIKETNHIRREFYDISHKSVQVDQIVHKLSCKVVEYEIILAEIKKNLHFQNIRRVYRLLHCPMPKELEIHL